MESNGLGPFTDVEVVTVTKGFTELDAMLANGQGWRILTCQFILEPAGGRRGTVDYREVAMLYTLLGRRIGETENRAAARQEAVEYANAQQDVTDEPLRDIPPLADEPDEPPLVKEAGPPNAPVRRATRRTSPSVAIGANHP